MTRAAETLRMAPSAVSSAIAALESRPGVLLFHRVGRRIELTGTRTLFLFEAGAVLARVQSAELMLAETGGLLRDGSAVQASQTIGFYWLSRHIVAFRRHHPGIDLRLEVGKTAQVTAAVCAGAADSGFMEGLVQDPSLDSTRAAHDRLVFVVGDGHPWIGCGSVSRAELADEDWVLRERGSSTRAALGAVFRRLRITLDVLLGLLELPSNEAVYAAVEAGTGATVISASVAAPAWRPGCCIRCPTTLRPATSGCSAPADATKAALQKRHSPLWAWRLEIVLPISDQSKRVAE